MDDSLRKKHLDKKKRQVEDIFDDEKIFKQLKEMQDEYIKDEEKKGNADVRRRVQRIQVHQSPKKEEIISQYKEEERQFKEVTF